MVLDKVQKVNDIKNLNTEELELLKAEIRNFLIDSISVTGGHLASNLGVVELTMALHLSFDLPKDKIVWDVGHQSYTHKILTGRREGFTNLRQYGGMSGFPKTDESDCDAFDTGHSSTSISAGLGLATARELKGEDNYVISVIGDGALTGGMAYEALNNASSLNSNFIIVLNDNNMSISENVGGVNKYLNGFRTASAYIDFKDGVMNSLNKIPVYGKKMVAKIKRTKSGIKQLLIPGMFFEEMGIMYLGPVDGSDINAMCKIFQEAKRVNGPVIVHVITKKGKGYPPAERHPSKFHGAPPFDIETGLPISKKTHANYTDVFSKTINRLAEEDKSIVAVTAAMEDGTGLSRFKKNYSNRFFDVGIAEAHAVTFSAGLAKNGLKPVFAVYSSFLQRGYDQIVHDVCLQNLPVVFAIDRAGLVGSDGETHQGIFDISFLSSIPNMTIIAPKNKWELAEMIKYAFEYNSPIAIRYPRGCAYEGLSEYREKIRTARAEVIYNESQIILFALGSMVKTAKEVHDRLKERNINSTLINARFAKPFDGDLIKCAAKKHTLLVTLEENVASGGFGEHVASFVKENNIDIEVLNIAIPDMYVEHGNVEVLYKSLKIDAESVFNSVLKKWEHMQE
ncbi:1-deoxy-D-xylulose-5-phosphate synthase [Lachnobacterium bovis]|uniref:1-deoxy-D-xylulose-5-phosphate synthase n=1 Tax=Lachnobacterium bovis TaxID=140626 RepID=UPI00048B5169|nr:1-deoxy-D-xylulose-5-phosphate synthase [Lachnobacterium bovis]